jgi:fatty-acyl-CoA synthase
MDNEYSYQLNLKNLFSNTLRNYGDREINYRNKEKYTFREFYRRVSGLAAGLESIGVNKGDVVAVIDWDTNRYMECYFAIPMLGAVMHTVNIRYPPELIYYSMNHAEDKYVIVRDEFLPVLEKSQSLFDFVKGWIVYNEDHKTVSTTLKPSYNYDDLILKSSYDFPDLDENTVSTIFYTSGTTGMPKGVTFTQRNLVMHTLALQEGLTIPPLNLTNQDVFMTLVPMFHVHSWGIPYLAFLAGYKYVLPGRYEVPTMLSLIKSEKVTFSAMVPSILYMILSAPNIEEYREYMKHWKVIIGGAALPRGLALKARALGITTIGAYGLSETAPLLTVALFNDKVINLPEEQKFEYMISTGIPVPMVDLKVVDQGFKEVPWDRKSVGEIVVRAPWLTKGYYKDPEKSRGLWKNGWLNTGDLAVVDDKGYITIVDREKDAVKSGGEFIPSLVLENVISECKGVGEVAVIGAPSEKWGERPVAFITVVSDVKEKDVYEHLNKYVDVGRIQKWWVPDRVMIIDTMPKSSTGKIDKKALRSMIK